MLKKSDVPVPSPLPEEVTTVPGLGEVLIRCVSVSNLLDMVAVNGYERMPALLAAAVFVDGDNGTKVPLYTAEEWERWGTRNQTAYMQLWDKAHSLSDIDGEKAEKKSKAQKSASSVA